jgi:hypothetical protein
VVDGVFLDLLKSMVDDFFRGTDTLSLGEEVGLGEDIDFICNFIGLLKTDIQITSRVKQPAKDSISSS